MKEVEEEITCEECGATEEEGYDGVISCSNCDLSGCLVCISSEDAESFCGKCSSCDECCDCIEEIPLITNLTPTKYEVFANPSHDGDACILTQFRAIDIIYQCPKCKTDRVVTWLFPDEGMVYFDMCCKQPVYFKGQEGEEE